MMFAVKKKADIPKLDNLPHYSQQTDRQEFMEDSIAGEDSATSIEKRRGGGGLQDSMLAPRSTYRTRDGTMQITVEQTYSTENETFTLNSSSHMYEPRNSKNQHQ